ncbi:CpsD/CapB family tyrosine-protein kinase [Mesobacillus subterraneus]|uniref:CpsD/CapB family tyrosine-protein kinase n=1 Tax=Mesobacillus subterraneus TaxID=285983 RepID=UPI0039AF0FD3
MKRRSASKTLKRNLVVYSNPDSIIAEQFRTLRTNIHFLTGGKKSILLLTSPSSSEGKSTSAANLALSIAQQKEKVLLIDANLRDPHIHFIFKIPNEKGLADVLSGQENLKNTVFQTEIGKLAILTSGQLDANPAELLGSDSMEELFQQALEDYDVILIDSPPVLEVTDTKLLANKSDGVVLVISEGRTAIEKATEAKKALEFAKAKIFGVILNEM